MVVLVAPEDRKMTEEEVMKALEICSQNDTNKHSMLTYHGMPLHILFEAIIDLLNRKNAEIERLAKEVDRLSQVVLYHDGQISDARAEAIKEFAENLLKYYALKFNDGNCVVTEYDMYNCAKEMGCGE